MQETKFRMKYLAVAVNTAVCLKHLPPGKAPPEETWHGQKINVNQLTICDC